MVPYNTVNFVWQAVSAAVLSRAALHNLWHAVVIMSVSLAETGYETLGDLNDIPGVVSGAGVAEGD